MKKLLFLIAFMLSACSADNHKVNTKFYDNMSFKEFKIKLEEYAKNNPFPNIDD